MAQKEQGSTGRKINSFMYKHCSVTPVALSNEVRRSIQQVYGLPEKQIPAIYNGIDLSKCSPKETIRHPRIAIHFCMSDDLWK